MAMTINTLKIQEPTSGRIYQLADIEDIDRYYAPRRPGKIDFLLINNLVPQAIIEKALRHSYLCNASRVYESQANELYQILMAFKDVTYQDENQTTYHLISTGTDATHGAYATTPDLMSKRRFLRAAQTCAQVGLCEFDTIRNITGKTIGIEWDRGLNTTQDGNLFSKRKNESYYFGMAMGDAYFTGFESFFNTYSVVNNANENRPYNISLLTLIAE